MITPELTDGIVRYEEAFRSEPFGNTLSTIALTGAELVAVLDQMATPPNAALLIGGGAYTWSASAPAGSHVVAAGVTVGGVPLDPARTYTVVVNSIVLAIVLGSVPSITATGVGIDLDALLDYLAAHSPVSPPPSTRITLLP